MKKTKNNLDSVSLHTFVILAYKESPYLEECIKSVLNQYNKSTVIIATTTPNSHIEKLADKYKLPIVVGKHTNIGGDFDFAIKSAATPLVTIAHQDDIYDPTYSLEIINAYQKYPSSSIIFTDYYELRSNTKTYSNANLKIKRILLSPIKIKHNLASTFFKRSIIRFGDAISCPTVTFVTKNCPEEIFQSNFKCNVDWHAWEKLSRTKSSFTFIPKPLMGHRISASTTTTEIINQGIRTKEDYQIFKRFWPIPIAKFLTKLYHRSEKSNTL